MEHFGAVFKLDLTEKNDAIARGEGSCLILPHTGYAYDGQSYYCANCCSYYLHNGAYVFASFCLLVGLSVELFRKLKINFS